MCRLLSSSSSSRHVFESQSSLIDQDSRAVPVYCMSVWLLNLPPRPPRPLPSALHSQPAHWESSGSQPDPAQEHLGKYYWQLLRLIAGVSNVVPTDTRQPPKDRQ